MSIIFFMFETYTLVTQQYILTSTKALHKPNKNGILVGDSVEY